MTASFDFSAQDVTGDTTREFVFDLIPGRPSLRCAPAHDSNPDYLDARLRQSLEDDDKAQAAARLPRNARAPRKTPDEIKAEIKDARDRDRGVVAKHCVKGWGVAPIATDGTAPEYTPENGLAFVMALPDFMFDPFRNWLGNVYNFVDEPIDPKTGEAMGNA